MMKKTIDKSMTFLAWLIGVLSALVIGGLFVGKTTTGLAVLKFIPAAVHPLIGWVAIIFALVGVVLGITKLAK